MNILGLEQTRREGRTRWRIDKILRTFQFLAFWTGIVKFWLLSDGIQIGKWSWFQIDLGHPRSDVYVDMLVWRIWWGTASHIGEEASNPTPTNCGLSRTSTARPARCEEGSRKWGVTLGRVVQDQGGGDSKQIGKSLVQGINSKLSINKTVSFGVRLFWLAHSLLDFHVQVKPYLDILIVTVGGSLTIVNIYCTH